MRTIRLILGILAIIWQGTVSGQIVINEILPGTSANARIELKNVGSTTVDISTWWVCRIAGGASYQQVSSLTTVSGNASAMNPGDIVVLSGRSLATADELGLYTTNSFGSSTAIHDYVQWGQVNMGRSMVAQAAGLWTAADSANTIPAGYTLQFDGDGQTGVGGYNLAMPSIGAENVCPAGGPDGGMVFTTSGSTSVVGVTGTGQLSFYAENTGQADTLSYWYIITDVNDNILTWVNANMMRDSAFIDISGAPNGVCHVWGWSYSGLSNPVVGDHISTLDDNICEEISSNWITVYRETPDGGLVSTTSGSTSVIGVTGTGQLSFYAENTGTAPNLSYWYIITDANDSILTWVNANMMRDSAFIDISGAPNGVCHVWGWSYRGLPNPVVGAHISTLNDDPEEDISDNWITVYRETPDGGMVSTTSGSTSVIGVTGTGQLTFYAQNTGTAPNLSYWYIITDGNDDILAWVNANSMRDSALIDISGAPNGVCHVWGWSYRGLSDPVVGNNISTLNDDPEEDISDNWITVYRETPDGGMVSTTDGSTSVVGVTGTGQLTFYAQNTGTAPNLSYWYIITDGNDDILAWVNANNMRDSALIDISGAPNGVCHVWGWSYRGLSDPVVGNNISTLNDDPEEDISDNWITVYRETPDGGMVSTTDGSTSVVGVTGTGQLTFYAQNTGTAPNLSYWYIITDGNDDILAWVNANSMRDSALIDISGAPDGVCHVWGWSYRGLSDPVVGNNISTLNDDPEEDISDNWITVYRETPNGGEVSLTNGGFSVSAPVGSDSLMFYAQNTGTAPNLSYWYIITDANDDILGWVNANSMRDSALIDISGAPAGICRVWGWSYRGLDDPIVGANISTLDDDVEEDISTNWITVSRIGATSVEYELRAGLTIFPNPTTNFLNIQSEDIQIQEVRVQSMDGKLLIQSSQTRIDVSELNTGIYLIQAVSRNGEVLSKRFLKN